jgi:hypothetical protein
MIYILAILDTEGEESTGLLRSDTEPVVGQAVTIEGSDCNGNHVALTGKVIEILDIREY